MWKNKKRKAGKNNTVLGGMKEEEIVTRTVVENIFKGGGTKKRSKLKWVSPTKCNEVIVVGLHNTDDKTEIWKSKHKIKGSNIFTDDDLTKDKRIRQSEIRRAAKIERGKGDEVRVGYDKIQEDGK